MNTEQTEDLNELSMNTEQTEDLNEPSMNTEQTEDLNELSMNTEQTEELPIVGFINELKLPSQLLPKILEELVF